MRHYIHSLQSEVIKTKRTAATWLALVGGFFIPVIILIGLLHNHTSINKYGPEMNIWLNLFEDAWRNMAVFLLPMGVVLAGSLITQIEYKNNTWKQVYASPQSLSNIFIAKFTLILFVIISFFVFFNIGILLAGVVPTLLTERALPRESIPLLSFLKGNAKMFIAILPVLALQYLVSLKFKNFLVPVGTGFLGLIGTLIAIKWKYIFLSPFSYCVLSVLKVKKQIDYNSYAFSAVYFVLLMLVSYYLYITKKEKG